MSGGGKGGSTPTTQGPPDWAAPYIQGGMQSAQQLYSTPGPQYYPGQTVAPFSPLQEQGFAQTQALANGPQLNQASNSYFTNLENGNYLNPASNPHLQGLVNQGFDQIQNRLSSEFAGSGRNIEASAPVQASQMSQLENQIYGGAYNNTLNNMTSALGQSNALTAGQYIPAQMLGQAGSQIQQQAQNQIGANQAQYNYYQNLPYQQLQGYIGAVNGIPMGKQVNQGYTTNPIAGGLGGALTGAELGSVVPGIGTGIGALGGGLLGLLGSYGGH